MSDEDLLQKLWESDEASALTNQAARRIEELKAREEAIVRLALEKAAGVADRMQGAGSEAIRNTIRSLASDAEVAALIKKAGERHD
jgi:hypothetical protein